MRDRVLGSLVPGLLGAVLGLLSAIAVVSGRLSALEERSAATAQDVQQLRTEFNSFTVRQLAERTR